MYIKNYFRIGSLLKGNQRGSRFLLRGETKPYSTVTDLAKFLG